MSTRRYEVYNLYSTFSRKVVEAETEEEAIAIAECIVWNRDQVLGDCEWVGHEVNEVDDDLTELTEDDKRMIKLYRKRGEVS